MNRINMNIIYKTFIHFLTLYINRKVDRIHSYSKHYQIFLICNNLFFINMLMKCKTYSETLNIMYHIYLLGLYIKELSVVVQTSFTLKFFQTFLGFRSSFIAFLRLSSFSLARLIKQLILSSVILFNYYSFYFFLPQY